MPSRTTSKPDTKKPAAKAARKATKSPTTETPAAEAPVAETPAAAEVENTTTNVSPIAVLEKEFALGLEKLANISAELSKLKNSFRTYHSMAVREIRTASKAKGRRNRVNNGERAPSGFVKPTLISNELAAFLKVPAGTEMARTEVTKALQVYIVEHKLKNKENGRIIDADAALSKLLKLKSSDQLTYFNLQKYMRPHFAKHSTSS